MNRRIVYASYEMGVGKEGISKLCEILNMPFSMSKLTWYNHEDVLFESHKDVVLAMLENNREEARKIALEEDGLDGPITLIRYSQSTWNPFMIGSVTLLFLADASQDSHKMPMSELMPLFGTCALNINGLARNELQLHLHQQPYISAAARKQNMMSWTRLALVWEPTLRLKAKGEIQRECHRQKRESKNSIKNTDWPGAKRGKGMKA